MNSKIYEVADAIAYLLGNLNCNDDKKKVADAKEALKNAMGELQGLRWDHLLAINDDKRHELTTRQQKAIECYAKLKRVLLEVIKELFGAVKEI